MATRKTATKRRESAKPSIVIDEDIQVGLIELPDSKGIRISLLQSAGKKYIAINRVYHSKTDDTWKTRNGLWLPFKCSYNIAGIMKLAYIEGLKRSWDKEEESVKPTPENHEQVAKKRQDIQDAITETQAALEHLKRCLGDGKGSNIDEQLSLFEKMKKSL